MMHWARAERYEFIARVSCVNPPTSKRVGHGLGKGLHRVVAIDVRGVHVMGEFWKVLPRPEAHSSSPGPGKPLV